MFDSKEYAFYPEMTKSCQFLDSSWGYGPNKALYLDDSKELVAIHNFENNTQLHWLPLESDKEMKREVILNQPGTKLNLIEIPKLDSNDLEDFEEFIEETLYPHRDHMFLISVFNKEKKLILFMKQIDKQQNSTELQQLIHNPLPIEFIPHPLFPTGQLCGYISKKNERRAVLLSGNDVLFIIKLDYMKIENAFPLIQSSRHSLFDITIKLSK